MDKVESKICVDIGGENFNVSVTVVEIWIPSIVHLDQNNEGCDENLDSKSEFVSDSASEEGELREEVHV